MGIFKKKGVDVVDLTDMQRRGLLEKSAEIENTYQKDNAGVIDFGSREVGTTDVGASPAGDKTASKSQSIFASGCEASDFLSSLAGVSGVGTAGGESPGPITSSLRNARQRSNTNSEINELRLKLDDSDFQIRSLNEKLKEVERRLNERGI
tara:strand:- start:251 stop:703 length:453 start_codon:yes stop_codon:yes gene_type:complete